MRILTYKRTHTGDPDENGCFGIHDCMGQVRDYDFEHVIGVGGIGREPKSYGIDYKINWVGINAEKIPNSEDRCSSIIKFKHFVLFEEKGPPLDSKAKALAERMYEGGARFLLHGYREQEKKDADSIINWAKEIQTTISNNSISEQQQNRNGCSIRGCGIKKSSKPSKNC